MSSVLSGYSNYDVFEIAYYFSERRFNFPRC